MNIQSELLPKQPYYIIRAQHNETGKRFSIMLNDIKCPFWYSCCGYNLFGNLESSEPAKIMRPQDWDIFFDTQEYQEHKHPTAEAAFAALTEWANKFNHTLTILPY